MVLIDSANDDGQFFNIENSSMQLAHVIYERQYRVLVMRFPMNVLLSLIT